MDSLREKNSVYNQIKNYLEAAYPQKVNGGDIERMTFITEKGKPAKPSNISRRLRDLSEDEAVWHKVEDGSVWYRAKDRIVLPYPFKVAPKETKNYLL